MLEVVADGFEERWWWWRWWWFLWLDDDPRMPAESADLDESPECGELPAAGGWYCCCCLDVEVLVVVSCWLVEEFEAIVVMNENENKWINRTIENDWKVWIIIIIIIRQWNFELVMFKVEGNVQSVVYYSSSSSSNY